jgi:hypothetical protein
MNDPTERDREEMADLVIDLLALRYLAKDALPGVARLLLGTVTDIEDARRFVDDILENFDQWPGPASILDRYRQTSGREPEPKWLQRSRAGLPPVEELPQ